MLLYGAPGFKMKWQNYTTNSKKNTIKNSVNLSLEGSIYRSHIKGNDETEYLFEKGFIFIDQEIQLLVEGGAYINAI